ncbi:hypothetical protein, partial [Klebsiella pneumoniae]|uniref:hypothetical protein n=1 Tax=Klebsiella pneumoniae TaxID=573 RepID=UPI00273114FD
MQACRRRSRLRLRGDQQVGSMGMWGRSAHVDVTNDGAAMRRNASGCYPPQSWRATSPARPTPSTRCQPASLA